MKRFSILVLASISLAVVPGYATPVTGILNFSGDAIFTKLGVGFSCDIPGGTPCPANSGDFFTGGPLVESGTFLPDAHSLGYVHSLNFASTPIDKPFVLPNFITFKISPNVVLNLVYLYSGVGGSCPPGMFAVCTPKYPSLVSPTNPLGKAPTNFISEQTGTGVSFGVLADAVNKVTGETTLYRGIFSTQFTKSASQILSQLDHGGSIATSYSATFVPTPEPATFGLIGAGLMAIAFLGRRR